MASWLVRSTPERAVRVRAPAEDIVLCSWARHCTLTVPLSTQVYKLVPANLILGVTLRWTSIPSRWEWPGGPQLARMQTLPIPSLISSTLRPRNLKTLGFLFLLDEKHFENGVFRQRFRHENLAVSSAEFSLNTNSK